MKPQGLDSRLARLASLVEPARRALYDYVVRQREPVSRQDAARGAGVEHHVAKFHLDRLAADGLLTVGYRRPAGRAGPGAGRPAKVYSRSALELDVSVPERRYDLAGALLAEAVDRSSREGIAVDVAVTRAAADAGRALGAEARRVAGRRPRRAALAEAVTDVLRAHGYEPCAEAGAVTLDNCPFDALARDHTELVCGMNLALLQGVVDGAEAAHLQPVLHPAPGRCCVRLLERRPHPGRRRATKTA